MDLPVEDGSATFDTYADVICAALDGSDHDTVLVGHSYAGNTIPLVASRRSIRHLVYLCAMVPEVGRSLAEQLTDVPPMLNPTYERGLSAFDDQMCQRWIDRNIATEMFYGDCDAEVTKVALDRLRPQSVKPGFHTTSLTEHPRVPTTYILCDEDQILRPQWSRDVVDRRLKAELVELPGGHSPMLSRPEVLAEVLLRLV